MRSLLITFLLVTASIGQTQMPGQTQNHYKNAVFFGSKGENPNGEWQASVFARGIPQNKLAADTTILLKKQGSKPYQYALSLWPDHPDYHLFNANPRKRAWRRARIVTKGQELRITLLP